MDNEFRSEIEYVIPVEGSLGLMALGDSGLKEWRKIRDFHNVVSAENSTFSIEQSSVIKSGTPGSSKKVLLIGWDGADWDIINPLLDSGQMPALEKLISNGVIANLATLDPPVSPMLWTSIATGKKADKHGILGFTEPDAIKGGIRPINVTSRKAKAIWNILNTQGKRCNVIGWWPSHPAEPINGVMVSNFFHKTYPSQLSRKKQQENEYSIKVIPGSVYPETIQSRLAELRVQPSEITAAHILPFIPSASEKNPGNTNLIASLIKNIAESSSIQAITTWLIKNTDWDLTAVYFDTIDHLCHGFMKFYPPKMKGIPENLFKLYRDVIPTAYKFHDMMLDRLISLAGDETVVILLSDHGFHTDTLRPRRLPSFSAAPVHEHSQYGILCISGGNESCKIKKDERIFGASLLDITPTILHIFDLPTARDMDGKILTGIFETRDLKDTLEGINLLQKETIESWEDAEVYSGNQESIKTNDSDIEKISQKKDNNKNGENNQELLQQLVDLGYIESPRENERNDKKQEAIKRQQAESIKELQYNLARVHISNRKFNEAISILDNLYLNNPSDVRYNLDLFNCYLTNNQVSKAEMIFANLKSLKSNIIKPESGEVPFEIAESNMSLLEGILNVKKGKIAEAILNFKRAENCNPRLPYIHLELGKAYLQINKFKEAERAFRKASEINQKESSAWHGLGLSLLRQIKNIKNHKPKLIKIVEYSLKAIGLTYHLPGAHYTLGEALYKLGKYEESEKAFRVCLQIAPNYEKARQWLERVREKTTSEEIEIKSNIKSSNNKETQSDKKTLKETIIVVSGLPRTGTSMMMGMLNAGGIELLTDKQRKPDKNNPYGYYEFAAVKKIAQDNSFLINAQGKAIKIIAPLLSYLPDSLQYKIIFMQRDLEEVLKSQQIMLGKNPKIYSLSLMNSYKTCLQSVSVWANKEPNIEIININYAEVIRNTLGEAEKISKFLNRELDIKSMQKAVDPELYRNKS